jgi:hypothetical protein
VLAAVTRAPLLFGSFNRSQALALATKVSKSIDDEDKERAGAASRESGKLMGDIQFLVLIVTIILCTVYVSNVVYLAGKAIREQVVRSADMIRESQHHAE